VSVPAGSSSNGVAVSNVSNGNGNGATSLVALGREPGAVSLVASGSAFDENQPMVAVAPGGEWSRFKSYGVLSVRPAFEAPGGWGCA
jgi:hypothetical protein